MQNIALEDQIRDLKDQLEKVKKERETLQNIYDTLSEAVYILDDNFVFLDVNKGAEKMYGLTKHELVGKTPADLAAPSRNNLDAVVSILIEVLQTGISKSFEFWALKKSGEEFCKEVIANKGLYKGKQHLIVTARDITERKIKEIEIQKFKSISEEAVQGHVIINFEGIIEYVNRYFAEIHGYKQDEIIGKHLSMFHSEKELEHVNRINKEFIANGYYSTQKVWHIHKNGTEFPMLMNGITIYDQFNNPIFLAATTIDISEQHYAQRERDQIINLSEDLICTANFDGYLTRLNPAWENTLGWTEKELKSTPFLEFIHPDDIEATAEAANDLTNGKAVLRFTNRYRCKDNSYKHLEWNTIPDFDTKMMFGIARDVTKQIEAEEKLKASEEKFRSLYDNAPLSYQSLDNDGYFIDINPTWLGTLGYKREEVIGKNYSDFLHPLWVEHFKINFPKFKERGYVSNVQFKLRHKKGHFIDVSFEGCIGYNRDGSFKQTYCVFKDITQQKIAEESLRSSEEKFKGLFHYSNIGIGITNLDKKIVDANPEFLSMIGYTKEEVVNMSFADLTHTDDVEHELPLLNKLINNEINSYRLEKRLVKKDGQILWCNLAVATHRDEKGNIDLFIGMIMDISQSKQHQKELITAKEKAEEADHLKSAFLANMSHEIRTPMNGIIGFTELLGQKDVDRETQVAYIDIIKSCGNRMLSTVNDIIDISKIDAGQVKVEYQQVNLIQEVEELYQFFIPEAKSRGLDFKLEIITKTRNKAISTDRAKIQSIITNLIKNAIKYTDTGSIQISVRINKDSFEYSIKDTGIGIPENRLEAIFNRFEQADIDDHSAREGSGLGLSIARSYARMLNGDITVDSELHAGSEFNFVIPLNEVKITADQIIEKSEDVNIKPYFKNVLIAEDDDFSFQHLSIIISEYAENIIRAKNGNEAVNIASDNTEIDCIFMDVKMPIKNGYDATREIRKKNKNVFIIAQTAYALQGEENKALHAGCNVYLSKPINKTELVNILRQI